MSDNDDEERRSIGDENSDDDASSSASTGEEDDEEDEIEINDDDIDDDDVEEEDDGEEEEAETKGGKGNGEDDDDEQDEDDNNYLEKFERDVNKNYVDDFHPECISHNYEEVAALCVVTRDDDCIINDPLHKTIPFLTKYERARVLGQRAKQIEFGDHPLVAVLDDIIESHIIAEMELRDKKIPFIIKRPIPGGGFEYWKLIDLELIAY
jgi:DNA-directed RNA polymerase I, II, and III subunit RPABC2